MSNNLPDDLQEYFRKRGIKTKLEAREGTSFIGSGALTPFSTLAIRYASLFSPTNTSIARIGDAYTSSVYQQDSKNSARTYEDVYGKTDYTVPVEQDSSTRAVLDEVFGNNDNDPTGNASGLSETGVKTSLSRTGTTKNALRNLIEVHNGLYQSQKGTPGIPDEETKGVRGYDDVFAPIDSIA